MSAAKLSVLFVDDETRVLDGMRRALHKSRERWTISFVEGGAAALDALASREYDVVITDMRMPGMDGAALLAEVALRYPRVVRVVLSGQTDLLAARRAAHVAHRFLAKPVEVSVIVSLLERIECLRTLLTDKVIAGAIGSTNLIASMRDPSMAALCCQSGLSPCEAAQCVRESPVLTAKTLQLAGSAFFTQPYGGTSLEDAITHVGVDSLIGVVCDDLPCPCLGPATEPGEEWRERMRSVAARAVDGAKSRVPADDAFIAGLLHDIGRSFVGETADADLAAAASAYLLGLWGLPGSVVTAVRWQDDPPMAGEHEALAMIICEAKRAVAALDDAVAGIVR